MGCWKCMWHHRLRGKCFFCVRVWDSSRLWWTFKRPTVVEQGTSQEATVAARLWKKISAMNAFEWLACFLKRWLFHEEFPLCKPARCDTWHVFATVVGLLPGSFHVYIAEARSLHYHRHPSITVTDVFHRPYGTKMQPHCRRPFIFTW